MKISIEKILEELQVLPEYENQIMLQTVEGQVDPFYGIGRLYNWRNTEDQFIHPVFDIPYTNNILKELKMFRTRVMRMNPHTCYSYHVDMTKRMHIPLITDKRCFFVIDDEVMRLPADGMCTIVDTTKKHTFINASSIQRIHIVGCVNES